MRVEDETSGVSQFEGDARAGEIAVFAVFVVAVALSSLIRLRTFSFESHFVRRRRNPSDRIVLHSHSKLAPFAKNESGGSGTTASPDPDSGADLFVFCNIANPASP